MTTPFVYPFDPTGTAASNRITCEQYTLRSPGWKDFYFVIPTHAPFFSDSLKVIEVDSGRELVEGVDWMLSHRFMDGSRATAKPLYGSISFFDKTYEGVVELSYQTIGGDWTLDPVRINELLTYTRVNPRITTWDEVIDVPYQFPVIDHEWNLVDLVGLSEVRIAIEGVAQTILDTADIRTEFTRHLQNASNPHGVSKTQVGLSVVENFPIATLEEAQSGLSDTAYMTPRRVAQAIETLGQTYITAHTRRLDNPHQVSKSQVGLGSLENYPIATKEVAQIGLSNTDYMTPLRTAELVDYRVASSYATHIANQTNPHGVTKTHIGLNAVDNFYTATENESRAGTRTDRFMTPLGVSQAFDTRFESIAELFVTPFGLTETLDTRLQADYYTRDEVNALLGEINTLLETIITSTVLVKHEQDVMVHAETLDQVGLSQLTNLTYSTVNLVVDQTSTVLPA